MCVKIVKRAGKTRLEFDLGRTIATIIGIASVITAITVITAKCNSMTVYAQDKYIKPIAELTFKQMHQPYDSSMCRMVYKLNIAIEMLNIAFDDTTILSRAITKVNNKPGEFRIDRKN